MKFYHFPPSPNVRKVDAVIAYLGIKHVDKSLVNLVKGEHRSPEYLAVNPMGKLPALAVGDDLLLWESNAICQYLCDRHGDTSFYPRNIEARADISRWLFWEASAWSRATEILTHENVRKPMMGIGEPDADRVREGEALFRPLAKLLDDRLAGRDFLAGNEPTLADFVVGGAATYMDRGRFPVGEFPRLKAWWARLNQVPAWLSTVPSANLPA